MQQRDTSLGGIKSNLFVAEAGHRRCHRDRPRRLKHQLPLALPEQQADRNVNAQESKRQGRQRRTNDPAKPGERLLWGQRIFPARGCRMLAQFCHLTEREFVGRFEGASANPAQH